MPADFLSEHNVQGWSDMPVWLPPVGEYAGFHRINIQRAIKAGVTRGVLDCPMHLSAHMSVASRLDSPTR